MTTLFKNFSNKIKILLISIFVLMITTIIFIFSRYISDDKKYKNSPKNLKSLRIAFIRTDFWFGLKAGGSVSHISGFCRGINKLGHKLFYISNDRLEGIDSNDNEIFIVKPPIIDQKVPLTLQIIAYNYTFFRYAVKVLKTQNPDFICQRHSILNISGVLLSLFYKIPLILEYNSSSFWKREKNDSLRFVSLLKLFEKINLINADKIMVVSSVLKEELKSRGIPTGKVCVNPNGVDPDLFNPYVKGEYVRKQLNLNDKIVIGFTGIYGPWHGVEIFAKSLKEVIKYNKNIRYLFVGDNKLESAVRSIGNKDNTDSYMIFVSLVPHTEIPNYLAVCDVLVSPHINMSDGSKFFGSPVKIFEYMAMGKAIIASDIGQLSEILVNHLNAYLVEPMNEKQIAKGIITLTKNTEYREKLGMEARNTCIENYTWEHNAKRVIDAYLHIK